MEEYMIQPAVQAACLSRAQNLLRGTRKGRAQRLAFSERRRQQRRSGLQDEPCCAWLSGDIKQGNTYYEDIHGSVGKFDFVMANPPFNVNGIDKKS